ncbi:hypothetical protein ACIPY2_12690 [Paenarthrobacter sp. NPDC089675]|uniref:hypothetical protein n=1 Tax=Paenarthrobacter sp. NPDC089675 TaxID=3364376 RepID=UPI003802ECE5
MTDDLRIVLQRSWSRCLDTSEGRPVRPRFPASLAREQLENIPFRARVSSTAGTSFVVGHTFGEFASSLTSAVTTAGVNAGEGGLLMLHAAGLADVESGRTVALVARSGMGKTTATRRLGTEFGYVTDETVALDANGTLLPYAKPLSVIVEDPPAPKRQMGPDELGLLRAPKSPALASVVLLDRDPDALNPLVTELDHAEALTALAPQTSFLGSIANPLQRLCSILDATGGALRVTYREAGDLAGVMPQLLQRAPVAKTWTSAVEAEPHEGGRTPGAGFLCRGEVVDAVEVPTKNGQGTELVALTGDGVVRVRGVGPAVWQALETPCDFESLAARIAPRVGLPEGYASQLQTAIEDLQAVGIVAS